MLGRGVVYLSATGFFALNEFALLAQLHRRVLPGTGEHCYCPVCKAGRARAPKPAPVEPGQPWQPRAARRG